MFWFKRMRINRMVQRTVIPALLDANLNSELFLVDKPNLRIKISVSERGKRTFTIHQKKNKKSAWSYTTYSIDEFNPDMPPFAVRSGSYPSNWK